MEELKTYFFIAGVAHEGKDKDWVRADDVLERLIILNEEIQAMYNGNVKLFTENEELRAENEMFIEFIKRTFGKDSDGIIEDLRELKEGKI